jgi:hypothetical protein
VNDPIGLFVLVMLHVAGFAVGIFYFFGPDKEKFKEVPNRNAYLFLFSVIVPGFFFALCVAAIHEALTAQVEALPEPQKGRDLLSYEQALERAKQLEEELNQP